MSVTPVQPPPSNADTRFWDRIARKYAKSPIGDMAGYERTLERTRELIGSDENVLELGCGTGTTAILLASSAGRYLATDLSPEMIAIADEKLAADPHANLSFAAATAESVSAPPGGFDAVLGFNYLHLVEDLPQTLTSIHGILRPGGRFISKTPSLGEMNVFIRMAIPLMRLIGKAPSNLLTFDEAALSEAIREAGFEIEVVERHGSKGKDPRPFIVARRR